MINKSLTSCSNSMKYCLKSPTKIHKECFLPSFLFVSWPMSGFTVSPKGPRELFLPSMAISKYQKCYKSNLNGLTVRLVDFGHDFFGLILVVLATFLVSGVQF